MRDLEREKERKEREKQDKLRQFEREKELKRLEIEIEKRLYNEIKNKNKQELERQIKEILKEKEKELEKKLLIKYKKGENFGKIGSPEKIKIKSKSVEKASHLTKKENEEQFNNLSKRTIKVTSNNSSKEKKRLVNTKSIKIESFKKMPKSQSERIFKIQNKKNLYKPHIKEQIFQRSPKKKEDIEIIKRKVIFREIEDNINSLKKVDTIKSNSTGKDTRYFVKTIQIKPILLDKNLTSNRSYKTIDNSKLIKKSDEIDNLKFLEIIDTKNMKRINVKKVKSVLKKDYVEKVNESISSFDGIEMSNDSRNNLKIYKTPRNEINKSIDSIHFKENKKNINEGIKNEIIQNDYSIKTFDILNRPIIKAEKIPENKYIRKTYLIIEKSNRQNEEYKQIKNIYKSISTNKDLENINRNNLSKIEIKVEGKITSPVKTEQ